MTKKNKATENPRTGEPTYNRCTATTKHGDNAGQRCKRGAVPGGTVCSKHGGSAPQVRAKATERLLEMVMPALATIRKIMLNPTTSDADALRAAQMVLNRTGFSERFGLELLAQQNNEEAFAPILAELQSGWDALSADERQGALAGGNEYSRLMGQVDRLQQRRELPAAAESGGGEFPDHEGDDLEQLNLTALRNANRGEADRESRILRDDDKVVKGTVLKSTDIVGDGYSPTRYRRAGLDEESELDRTPTRNGRTPGKARTTRQRVLDDLGESDDGRRG